MLADCPICNAYAPELRRIAGQYDGQGVALRVVHVDPDLSVAAAARHADLYELPGPVLWDPAQVLVDFSGATMAPEVVIVDSRAQVVYRGRIDNLYAGWGKRRAEATSHDLRDALDAVLRGQSPVESSVPPIGCYLPKGSPGS